MVMDLTRFSSQGEAPGETPDWFGEPLHQHAFEAPDYMYWRDVTDESGHVSWDQVPGLCGTLRCHRGRWLTPRECSVVAFLADARDFQDSADEYHRILPSH